MSELEELEKWGDGTQYGDIDQILATRNSKVTDGNIKSAAVVNGIIGVCFAAAFMVLQSRSILYRLRLVSPSVTIKPPPLPKGVHSLWAWLVATLMTSDEELLQSAGLDALMLVKTMTMGLQLFVPIAFIGLVVLCPVHANGGYLANDEAGNKSQFMRLTTTNIKPRSDVLWLHCVLTVLYIGYGCWLLKWHVHQFTIIRQKWLQAGETENMWRVVFEDAQLKKKNQAGAQGAKQVDAMGQIKTLLQALPLLRVMQSQTAQSEKAESKQPEAAPSRDNSTLKASRLLSFERVSPGSPGRQGSGTHASLASHTTLGTVGSHGFRSMRVRRRVGHQVVVRSAEEEAAVRQEEAAALRQMIDAELAPVVEPRRSGSGGAWDRKTGSPEGPGAAVGDGRRRQTREHLASIVEDGMECVQGAEVPPPASVMVDTSSGTSSRPDVSSLTQYNQTAAAHAGGAQPGDQQVIVNELFSARGLSLDLPRSDPAAQPTTSANKRSAPLPVVTTPQAVGVGRHSIGAKPARSPPSSTIVAIPASNKPGSDQLVLDELPQWWMGTNTTYNPAQVAMERQVVRANKHRRNKSWNPGAGSAHTRSPSLVSKEGGGGSITGGGRPQGSYAEGGLGVAPRSKARLAFDGRAESELLAERSLGMHAPPHTNHHSDPAPPAAGTSGKDIGGCSTAPAAVSVASSLSAAHSPRATPVPSVASGGAIPAHMMYTAKRPTELLARPSVRHLKTVNTVDKYGQPLSVNAQQYAVLVTDVNQHLWTGEALWPRIQRKEGHGFLSWLIPSRLRGWIMHNYAVHASTLYSDSSDDDDDDSDDGGWDDEQDGSSSGGAHSPHLPPRAGSAENPASQQPGTASTQGGDLRHTAHEQQHSPTSALGQQGTGQQVQTCRQDGSGHSITGEGGGVEGDVQIHRGQGGHQGCGNGVAAAPLLPVTPERSLDQVATERPSLESCASNCPPPGQQQQQQQQEGRGPQASEHESDAGDRREAVLEEGAIRVRMVTPTGENVPGGGGVAAVHTSVPGEDPNLKLPRLAHGPAMLQIHVDGCGSKAAGAIADVGGGDGHSPRVNAGQQSAEESRPKRTAKENWAIAAQAMWDGRVVRLLLSKRYSVVTATFKKLFPEDFDRAIPVMNHKKVDLLLHQLDYHVALYTAAKEEEAATGKAPTRRLGFCGLWGDRVDWMEHQRAKIVETQQKLKDARKEALESGHTPSWWVFFKSQETASVCVQTVLHAEDDREFKVRAAPGPEEVNWPALWLTHRQRVVRSLLVQPLLLLLICIPVGLFTGGLMQLDFLFCPSRKCQLEVDTYINKTVFNAWYTGSSTSVLLDAPTPSGGHDGGGGVWVARNTSTTWDPWNDTMWQGNITTTCLMEAGGMLKAVKDYFVLNASVPGGVVLQSDCSFTSDTKAKFEWEWYCSGPLASTLSKLITGWLPGLLLSLWQGMVLPLVTLLLTQAGGSCFSLSQVDQQVAKYIFWYNTLQSFLGGMLGSALVQQINQFFEGGPTKAIEIFGTFLPSSSNFFVSYMLARALMLIPMRFLIPHVGIRMFLFRRWVFRCAIRKPLSDRERATLYTPTSTRMGFEVGMTLLIFLIAMAYSVVAPIMPAIGVGYLILSWLLWRFSVLYIFVRKYESGGLMFFPFVYERMVIILAIFGVFTACVFIVKKAIAQALVVLVATPLILVTFHSFMYHRFMRANKQLPLKLAHNAPRAHVPALTYVPPPLLSKALGWCPGWQTVWSGWNVPNMYSVT